MSWRAGQKRVELRIDRPGVVSYLPVGAAEASPQNAIHIHPKVLRCQIRVQQGSRSLPAVDCLVDTGAYLTLFPFEIWSRFPPNSIRWLKAKQGDRFADRSAQARGATGDRQPAALGQIEISIGGADANWSEGTIVVAKFASANAKLNVKEVLLGMSVIENMRGRLVVDFRSALGSAHVDWSDYEEPRPQL